MCNCKGWDIAFYPDHVITAEQHFCRMLDDCGHVDNTIDQVADNIATEYDRLHDWYCDMRNRGMSDVTDDKLDWFVDQSRSWRDRSHPDYIYYTNPEH